MYTKFKKGFLFTLGMLVITLWVQAQPTQLDAYIHEAFDNNQELKQRTFQLEKSMYALKEARSLFLPEVSLLGTYTKTAGGRTIDVPIGDLLNPVYSSLNQLTGTGNFPKVDNVSFLLNPDNFYDAKFRTSLTLINAEIWYNEKIKHQMIDRQAAEVNVYRRELVKNIKTAYYQYCQALRSVDIYNNALLLVKENIRVNESFLRNGVRNSTALTRAETEQQKIEASINQAENNRKNAQAYFNFLLNRSLTDTVMADSASLLVADQLLRTTGVVQGREELQELDKVKMINVYSKKMHQAYIVPKLNTFLDLGSQGFDWKYNNKTQYYMWGVNLQWDLFASGRNHYRTKQAAADIETVKAQYASTEQALRLQEEQAVNDYNTAVANYKTAQKQQMLSGKYYTDQLKVYKAGQLLYIELLDAQNQLTAADLQLAVAYAGVQIAGAGIERAVASYPLK